MKDVNEMTDQEYLDAINRLENQILMAKVDLYVRKPPEPVPAPEPEAKRTIHFPRILRALIPALMLAVLAVAGLNAQKASAAEFPCSANPMSQACTNCIVNTPIGEGRCMSQIDSYSYGNNPISRRQAALAANGTLLLNGVIRHADGDWPVTERQWSDAQRKGLATPPPQAKPDTRDLGQQTTLEPAASTYEYSEPMETRTKWTIGIFAALGLVLAFKVIAPMQFANAQGKASVLNSTVAPHARDFTKGLRRFAPGLYWLFRFEDFKTFMVKMVILLFGCFLTFSVLWGLLGTPLALLFIGVVVFALGRLDTARTVAAKVETGRWWEPKQFTNALIAAGIVAKAKAGALEPVSVPAGQPITNAYGTEAKFDLPGALTADMVNKKKGSLAKALRVPMDRLLVDQGRQDPEGTVTVWIGTGKGEGTQIARTPEPGRHDATSPFVVGRTVKGEPITIKTRNVQTLLAGQPGQGKTFLGRRMILHWLADPMGRVYVVDAKGDNDYVEGAPYFSAYVTTASGDKVMLANVEKVLTHIFGVMNDHNARRCLNESPRLLVLEEWWSVLATATEADPALRKRIDYLMSEITKKGRAANIHVLLVSQEMRDESISAKVRGMFQQAMAFALASPGEQRMVFGSPLTVRPAVDIGEVNIKVNGRQSWVKADLLDDDDWVTAVNEMTPRDPLTLTEVTPIDPLTLAVMEAVSEHGDLEPQALFDLLPEDLRTGTPATLGKALGKVGIASEMVSGRRVYRLAAVQAAVQGA